MGLAAVIGLDRAAVRTQEIEGRALGIRTPSQVFARTKHLESRELVHDAEARVHQRPPRNVILMVPPQSGAWNGMNFTVAVDHFTTEPSGRY